MHTDDADNRVTSTDAAEPSDDQPGEPSDAQASALAQRAEQVGRLEASLEQVRLELSQTEERIAEELAREAESSTAATEAWTAKLAKLREAVASLREAQERRVQELNGAHEKKETELRATHDEAEAELHAKHDEAEAELRAEHEQRENDLRSDRKQRDQDLVDRDKEIAVLSTQLEARGQELERRSQEHQEAAEALERERTRSLEAILDTRMATVESFAKMASERIGGQIEVLRDLEERSSKQEILTDRLLTIVSPSASPLQAMGSWLHESRLRLMAVTLTGILLFAFFLVGVVSTANRLLGSGETSSGGAAPTATANLDEAEAGDPAAAEPEGEDPSGAAAPTEGEEADTGAEEAGTLEGETGEDETDTPEQPAQLSPEQEAQRKALRRKMFDAHRKKRWGETARLGVQLREEYNLDWEAQLKLADALRRGKKIEEAAVVYLAFIEQHPDNDKIVDALFKAANLLVKLGRTEEALPLYERVSKLPKSEFKREAKKALKALR